MNLSRATLLAHARSDAGRRAMRYSGTSLVAVTGTQILLFGFQVLKVQPVIANFVAVTLMSVPAFILNKRWVWGKRGKAHFRREVLPFWLFTVAGWILSTLAVALVVDATKTSTHPHGSKLAVQAANIAGFGILWVLKYLFLDKIMFGAHHHTPYDEDIEAEEAQAALAEAGPTVDAEPLAPTPTAGAGETGGPNGTAVAEVTAASEVTDATGP